jgi:hypothetical protein
VEARQRSIANESLAAISISSVTVIEEGANRAERLWLKLLLSPPQPPILEGSGASKSPRIGGFRGHSRIYARDDHELRSQPRMKIGIGTL